MKFTQLGNSLSENLPNLIAFRNIFSPRLYLSNLVLTSFSPRAHLHSLYALITRYPEAFAINGVHRVVARAILSIPCYGVMGLIANEALSTCTRPKLSFTRGPWTSPTCHRTPQTTFAISDTLSAQALLSPRAAVGRIDSKAVTSRLTDRPPDLR